MWTFHRAKAAAVKAFEKEYLMRLLERTGGNIAAASRAGGVDRVHLYRLLTKHNLRENALRSRAERSEGAQ